MSAPLPVSPLADSTLTPLPLTDVTAESGFWARLQRVNRDAIIPHCDFSLERVGWINNFRAAAKGTLGQERVGRLFTDSELYKTMEAMAWENARASSPELEERLAAFAELVAGAQSPDGYLNTYFGWEGGPARWSDLDQGHELYCAGHLIQAAVAVLRAGGPAGFVEVARRLADLICEVFGPDGIQGIDGHPEIETALVELYRATGERRYLDQAKLFVDRRGHQTLSDTFFRGRDYYQDRVPVREARVLTGHAVRALYLAAGAVDVAVETGDLELLEAVRRQYDTALRRRTYLHGGMGSNHHGESFGDDFELPSERAYAETCAAVALIFWAQRLLLATGKARYADEMERVLYNGIAGSTALDGRSFFYSNPLQLRTGHDGSHEDTPSQRLPWYSCACCPPNLARLMASLQAYAVTGFENGLQIHLYAAGTVTAGEYRFGVRTSYPWDERIDITLEEAGEGPFTLSLRVPAWCRDARLTVNGSLVRAGAQEGYLRITRSWKAGDVVSLVLAMPPRLVAAHPRVDAVRGSAALTRGPVVYCIEHADLPAGGEFEDWELDASSPLTLVEHELAPAIRVHLRRRPETSDTLYRPLARQAAGTEAEAAPAIPYFLWANRAPGPMRVWIPLT